MCTGSGTCWYARGADHIGAGGNLCGMCTEEQCGQVPVYLRDAHYSGAEKLGNVGYKYAHDYENHYVEQQYLPDQLVGRTFYKPGNLGYEKHIQDWFHLIKKEK